MRTAPGNSVYRNNKYCDIPKCDEGKYECANRSYTHCHSRSICTSRLIFPTENILLNCGCLPFEYKSHLPNCKYWNVDEDQAYYPGCLS